MQRRSSRQRLRPQLDDLLSVHAACDTTSANLPFFLSSLFTPSLHCLLSFVCGVPAGQRLIPEQRIITLSPLASLQLPLSSLTSRSDARTLRREQILLVSNRIISPNQLGETCCSCNTRVHSFPTGVTMATKDFWPLSGTDELVALLSFTWPM